MIPLQTELAIAAPVERVWRVLTDFASYPDWNPLIVLARGEARAGARVAFRVRALPSGPPLRFTATLQRCDGHRLEWTGGVPLVFRGRHSFRLIDEAGGTRLLHGEEFTGVIARLMGRRGIDRFRPAYEAMNEALARRVAEGA
jgi:hypothetical protein